VDSQNDIYSKLGVDFPKWKETPLGLKEMEHALCEYSKYKKVDSTGNALAGRMRNMSSRLSLDVETCRECNINADNGLYCDTCFLFYCSGCLQSSGRDDKAGSNVGSWICSHCRDFEGVAFLS